MFREFYLLIFIASSIMLISSCRKDGHARNENRSVTLNVTINAGDVYQLNLAQYGDADDLAMISKQAAVYSISEIGKNNTGNNIYKFSTVVGSKTGGTGTDQVVLKVYEPEGRCRNHDETNVTINFTIL